ncbi:MIT domain-containing 1 isoform X2 [Brachionus plicatilis]|uniref:MIT domain-containing 1 isoform X2 n=1 Tax=Brachionus plicatilis TaxID=10195 RepID=A0A3M7RWF3_BRAPC|nr:MIT domain-containing 1 isoform X2 [Brachionus plicatilis]
MSQENSENQIVNIDDENAANQVVQSEQTSAPQNQEDNFDNLQKAVQILAQAKQLDELKRYDKALTLYRQGVDMLLEEMIVRQGTEQSRSYLRDKCNDFMNRIDQLKMMLQNQRAENKENEAKI